MKNADLRRNLVEALRRGDLSLVATDLVRCVAIATGDDEIATRLVTKITLRHRFIHGPRRNLEEEQRLADAVIWLRFNKGSGRQKKADREKAISIAAQRYGLPVNLVARAYGRRNEKVNALVDRRVREPSGVT